MNLDQYTEEVNLIEEKTIRNVEHHFKEYLMVDVVGQERVETIFDKDDWKEYWADVTEDINALMNKLLKHTGLVTVKGKGYDYNKKSKVNDLIKRLIECKYVIDYGLHSRDSTTGKVDDSSYIIPSLDVSNRYSNKEEVIKIVHTFLLKNDLLETCQLNEFKAIFRPITNPILLQWKKDAICFAAFVNTMLDKGIFIVPTPFKEKHWEYFKLIFLNEQGKFFNIGTLGNRRSTSSYDIKKDFFKTKLLPLLSDVSRNS